MLSALAGEGGTWQGVWLPSKRLKVNLGASLTQNLAEGAGLHTCSNETSCTAAGMRCSARPLSASSTASTSSAARCTRSSRSARYLYMLGVRTKVLDNHHECSM